MAHAELRVWVCYAAAGCEPDVVELRLAPGATAGDAVAASGLLVRHPGAASPEMRWAIDGQRIQAATPLQADDRVDLCGPLLVDPMQARRARAEVARAARSAKPRRR